MRRSSVVLIAVLSFGAGCAPKLSDVSIDTSAIILPSETFVAKPEQKPPSLDGATQGSVPAIKARNVLVGSGTKLAQQAVEAAKKNQERAFKQALRELRDAYLAEAKSGAQEDVLKLRLSYEDRFKSLYAVLRTIFEEHAQKVGPLWTRLATLRGFPLKPGRVRAPAEADFLGRAEAKEAVEVKDKIDKLDLEYRQDVARRVEGLRQEWRADLTELEAKRITALDAAGQKAEADAQKMVTEVLKGLEQSMIRDIERLPAVPGATVNLPGVRVAAIDLPEDKGPPWTAQERLERRMGLFTRLKGYRLVKPGPGVRDVTKEYMTWETAQLGR